MFRKDFAALALVLTATQAGAEPLTATRYADFDRYVLALSWQTGFCQSIYDRNRNEPEECRLQQDTANKADFLTVHGLWPGLPKSIAARGVDERRWMRYGCATRPVPNMPEVKANRKCQAAETGLSLEMANKLNNVMPGSGGTSCLERYEYAKHGVCFGFDPDSYFGAMVRLNGEIKRSPVGDFRSTPRPSTPRWPLPLFCPSLTRVTAAHSLSSIRLATSAKRDADWKTPSAGWCCTLNVRFITSNCRQLSV